MNAGYKTSYKPHKSADMAAMEDHDYTFFVTTALPVAQTARINQLLDTIDSDFDSA